MRTHKNNCTTHVILAEAANTRFKLSILQLGPVLFGGTPAIIAHLQAKHVLASHKQCPCGTAMQLQDRSDNFVDCRWLCPACRKGSSIIDVFFFSEVTVATSEVATSDILVGTPISRD